jgi:tetratricopeptide (TPR) repeat protein
VFATPASRIRAEMSYSFDINSATPRAIKNIHQCKELMVLKSLQIATVAASTLLGAAFLPSAWVSFGPDLDFFSFLGQASVLSPLVTIATTTMAIWAFILGWDPTQKFLQKARAALVGRVFISKGSMIALISFSTTATIALITNYYTITRSKHEILNLVLQENYDAADLELAKINIDPSGFADLYVITNATRQLTRNAGQAGDQAECRIYLNYINGRSSAFMPLWNRYLMQQAKSSCLQVLDNPGQAATELEKAKKLTDWLSEYESRRVSRILARIYLQDKNGSAGIKDKDERLQRIVSLISTDPDRSAIRMLGAARFEQGDFSQAIELWSKSLGSENDPMEIKKLKNNIALAYASMSQPEKAAGIVYEALKIPFSDSEEDQRREHIRLLSTGASIEATRRQCKQASELWKKRLSLMHQDKAKCAWLIEAQVENCTEQGSSLSENKRERVIEGLLQGTGQSSQDFKDRTPAALTELVKQAELRFKECYVGLIFQSDAITKAVVYQ